MPDPGNEEWIHHSFTTDQHNHMLNNLLYFLKYKPWLCPKSVRPWLILQKVIQLTILPLPSYSTNVVIRGRDCPEMCNGGTGNQSTVILNRSHLSLIQQDLCSHCPFYTITRTTGLPRVSLYLTLLHPILPIGAVYCLQWLQYNLSCIFFIKTMQCCSINSTAPYCAKNTVQWITVCRHCGRQIASTNFSVVCHRL